MIGTRTGRLGWALAMLIATPSLAPTTASAADERAAIEEVIVTGSRITRGNVDSPQPITTISADDITRTGTLDIGEVLNDVPALLSSVTGSNSLDSAAQNSGESDNQGGGALNLRGLGFERTLTLVNGRRHVAGIEGTSAVDPSTIPAQLIERVEVLTGGASAVYGADAVTGVVNFILKDDYEGFELELNGGLSGETDGESFSGAMLFGKNFGGEKGNVTLSLQYRSQEGVRQGDREFVRNGGLADDDRNPARQFQTGDINAESTPAFAQFYSLDTGRYPRGFNIPTTADAFVEDYTEEFGAAPSLSAAELSLIERAATAPPQAFLPGRVFSLTSPYGVVAPGDFGGDVPLDQSPDLDGDGTADCVQSFQGFRTDFVLGGCWFIDAAGELQPYEDGLISDSASINQFGASQSLIAPNRPFIIPETEQYTIAFNGRYEFAPQLEAFWETKYDYQEVTFGGGGHDFRDLVFQSFDNPFLPQELVAAYSGITSSQLPLGQTGLHLTKDSDDWGSNESVNERSTTRFVAGLRGAFDNLGLDYEVSANYGRFQRDLTDPQAVIQDRFFAAIDVVTDPASGEPVCRSDLDASAYPYTTPFDLPAFVGGGEFSSFFTFTPGSGQCQPANLWGGRGGTSQASIDFFTRDRTISDEIEQTVFSGFVSGSTESYFNLPGGPVAFVVGVEWREETTATDFDRFDNGILPVGGITAPTFVDNPDSTEANPLPPIEIPGGPFSAGQAVAEVSAASSLGATPGVALNDYDAEYDVLDYFAEIQLPLLSGVAFAEELSFTGAFRRADYSTFGTNDTWSLGGVWAPDNNVRLRVTQSQAIRVPNLSETFSIQGQFYRPDDPCDEANIGIAPDAAVRQANCVQQLQQANVNNDRIFDAAGDYIFQDPLTAGFPGQIAGNPDLNPEEGSTLTYGFVLTPEFIPGLSLSLDWWEIDIEDAIVEISSQNIVDRCVDSPTLDNAFCPLVDRNMDPDSAQSGGFSFLRQQKLNFGSAVAQGLDISASYSFDLLGANWQINLNGTKQDVLEFVEPAAPGADRSVDVELGEMRRPEWSGLASLAFVRGPLNLALRSTYVGRQTLGFEDGGEIETARQNFGRAGFADEMFIHTLTGGYEFGENLYVYGGVNNLTDEEPYRTERSYPATAMGRYFFAGVNWRLGN